MSSKESAIFGFGKDEDEAGLEKEESPSAARCASAMAASLKASASSTSISSISSEAATYLLNAHHSPPIPLLGDRRHTRRGFAPSTWRSLDLSRL